MNKTLERLKYQNQKAQNQFFLSITLLLSLFAIRNEFDGDIKLVIFAFLFPLLIWVIGVGLIKITNTELEYINEIKDKRFKESKWEKTKKWTLYAITVIVAIIMTVVAINIWKEIFLATYG